MKNEEKMSAYPAGCIDVSFAVCSVWYNVFGNKRYSDLVLYAVLTVILLAVILLYNLIYPNVSRLCCKLICVC